MPINRSRRTYLIAFAAVFLLGLPTRLVPQLVPAFCVNYAGDAMWAMAIFIGLGILFPRATTHRLFFTALLITYAIEFSELYQADWINQLRSIKVIGLILGYTFLWTDLVAYAVGIVAGAVLDHLILSRANLPSNSE